MVSPVVIAGRAVGPGHACFLIAEAGVNHNGDVDLARRLIEAAARAGADAVKFQTFSPEALASEVAPQAAYQRRAAAEESQLAMLRRLALPREAYGVLIDDCRRHGVLFLSSPFDDPSADLLRELGVPAFKIPSGEITDLRFLTRLAAMGRPMLVSTGMATEEEVGAAVTAVRAARVPGLVLLQCTSAYPASPADANLRAMATMAARYGCPVGYSDHTMGTVVSAAAVALGACVIEKHFTLDRALPGPDHQASATPDEFARLAREIRDVEAALGHGRKAPSAAEAETAAVARKSLVAACVIPAGTGLTDAMLAVKRPGTGLPPTERPRVIGRRAARDIPAGAVISRDMLR